MSPTVSDRRSPSFVHTVECQIKITPAGIDACVPKTRSNNFNRRATIVKVLPERVFERVRRGFVSRDARGLRVLLEQVVHGDS